MHLKDHRFVVSVWLERQGLTYGITAGSHKSMDDSTERSG